MGTTQLGKIIHNMIIKKPYAISNLKGSDLVPELAGAVKFFPFKNGTIVMVEVSGLLKQTADAVNQKTIGPFGFHIHEGETCDDYISEDAFKSAGGHYNPNNMQHPNHSGDLPVLFSNDGYAFMIVYTNRFKPNEIINRTVVIHLNPDDFRSQPAGNSGIRIACGLINKQNSNMTS